jgi:ribosomal protein L7/L12
VKVRQRPHNCLVTHEEHVDAISTAGRQCFADGAEVDEVLVFFADSGLGIIAAIRAAMVAFGLGLVDARELVESAEPYNSSYATVDWHQEVLQRLKPALSVGGPRSPSTH